MAALTHSPLFPAPKAQTSVAFALTQSGSDFIRVWCTVAPTDSELDKKINSANDPRNRYLVFEGSVSQPWNFTFDKGGKYTFVAQEYLKGGGYGGGYEGDPNGAANEVQVGSESTLVIYIGQKGTQVVGPPGNQATLTVWVWDNTIRATTKAFHGEDTPSLVALSTTPQVKTAIESATVIAALAALVDQTITTAAGDVSSMAPDFWANYNSHLGGSYHDTSDSTLNNMSTSFATAYGQKDLQEFVNKALQVFKYHITDDASLDTTASPFVFGPGSADYHNQSDRASLPLYDSVGSFSDAYAALADLHRCFELHRVNAVSHNSADNVHALDELPLILQVHRAYLRVLASTTPTVPPAQSTGMQTLISAAGFKES